MKRKVAIWGTGSMALKFYYSHKNQYDVVAFFDNDSSKHGNYIDGKPVADFCGGGYKALKDNYIIIASTWYSEIALQLSQMGKKPFVDYIPSCFLNSLMNWHDIYKLGKSVGFDKLDYTLMTDKKIAVLYGNCQTRWLERAFTLYEDFTKEYLIIEVPKVWNYENPSDAVETLIADVSFWKNIDLFIYQTVGLNNKFNVKAATSNFLSLLNENALKVNILNIYFSGYFPQMTVQNDNNRSDLFPFGDKYVDDMLLSGMSQDLIKQELSRDDFIPKEVVISLAQDSLNELISREKKVDIKITDYILANYHNTQLFYSNAHPIGKVMLEYANRIMQHLGYMRREISMDDIFLTCGTLKGWDIPVYPSVANALELEKCEKKFYPNRDVCNDLWLGFEEYIELYIENCKIE